MCQLTHHAEAALIIYLFIPLIGTKPQLCTSTPEGFVGHTKLNQT